VPEDCNPSHACLVPRELASGLRYRFEYTWVGGPHDDAYRVVARPITYGPDTRRSFYLDQTGLIGFTDEDRSATDDDPVVGQAK